MACPSSDGGIAMTLEVVEAFAGCEIRQVPGFDGAWAGADGFIYSTRKSNRWPGEVRRLAGVDNGRGYLRSNVCGKPRAIHVLIASAFHGPRPGGMEVNHRDGIKANNRPCNLEYVTRSENMKHCFRSGLGNSPTGERHHMTSLTEVQVARLRHDYVMLRDGRERMPNGAMRHLQYKYGISDSGINGIVRGLTWK